MPKVTIIQVLHNHRPYIEKVFSAIFAQTFKDFDVVAVIAGNDDGGKEFLIQQFPQVKIIDPGFNIGFAAGHNLVFSQYKSEFFQLLNPDMIMEPNYIEEMLKAFADEQVGAATGKLYQIDRNIFSEAKGIFASGKDSLCLLDTTGVTINKSGRMRDRGQHEVDTGQYDNQTVVDAVSGAGCMYRRAALEAVRVQRTGDRVQPLNPELSTLTPTFEYFDEDFHSYWEDVDLSWRMTNAGWQNIFVPSAIGYHARGTGSTPGGYKKVFAFINYHRDINPWIRKQNYKNHIFTYVKNSPKFYPQFFVRELAMFFYLLIFEATTLAVIPSMLKLFPVMKNKRLIVKNLSKNQKS